MIEIGGRATNEAKGVRRRDHDGSACSFAAGCTGDRLDGPRRGGARSQRGPVRCVLCGLNKIQLCEMSDERRVSPYVLTTPVLRTRLRL
jgi:hypothetical protein